jgi:hypothetical protein
MLPPIILYDHPNALAFQYIAINHPFSKIELLNN